MSTCRGAHGEQVFYMHCIYKFSSLLQVSKAPSLAMADPIEHMRSSYSPEGMRLKSFQISSRRVFVSSVDGYIQVDTG